MLLSRIFAAAVCFALFLTSSLALAADRGPSTPEERKQAVEYVQDYLSNPLGPKAHDEREWVIKWAIEVPDVNVSICSILEKLPKGNKQDADAIFAGMVLAQTAFAIQNLDAKANSQEAYLAGISGALQVYQMLLEDRPKDRQPYLDDLVAKQASGALTQYVQGRVAKSCGK
jgi:hypothetical protein